jgi:NTE family protein
MSTARDRCRRKTAFVFAGGGSFGAVQAGMLAALTARGIVPDMVVGSSVGAINAAFYAGNPTVSGVAELSRIWKSLRRSDVFPVTWRSLIGYALRRDGLWTQDGLRRLVRTHVPFTDLSDARIPLHVVATDILSGEEVVLSSGPAEDAIVASAAIPAAFAPLEIGGRLLADGAIASNTPVKAAVARGARRVFVLPTGLPSGLASRPRGAIAVALQALTLVLARQMSAEIASLESGIDCHIVPPPPRLAGSPCDFSRTAELIDRAAETAASWLDSREPRRIAPSPRPFAELAWA